MISVKHSLRAAIAAATFASCTAAFALPTLVSENPWGQTLDQQAMETLFGMGNWSFYNSYSAVDTASLLSADTGLIYLQGSDGSDTSLASYLSVNSAALLSWVDNGGRLLIESAGQSTSIDLAGVTLEQGVFTDFGRLTQTAIDSFTIPVDYISRSGSSLAHDVIVASDGITLTVLAESDDTSNPDQSRSIVAGFQYGKGYILYSGLTTYNFHNVGDGGGVLGDDASSWMLNLINYLNTVLLAPSVDAQNTLAALGLTGNAIRSAVNVQLASLNSNLATDCTTFSSSGACLALTGRYVRNNGGSSEAGYAKVTTAFRLGQNFRVGAFLDKGVDNHNQRELSLSTNHPAFGVFGVWNEQADGYGLQARVSAAYSQNDAKITRSALLEGTEAGSGKTDFSSVGYAAEVSYAFPVNSQWAAKPYVGLRYTELNFDRYQEKASDDVTAPLSYRDLKLESTTAIAGLRFIGQITQPLRVMAHVGAEHDLNQNFDRLRGTSAISGLESFDVEVTDGSRRSRTVAGVGAAYALPYAQEVSLSADWYQQSFSRDNGSSVTASYSIGF